MSNELSLVLANKDIMAGVVGQLRKDNMIARLGSGEVFFLTENNVEKRAFKVKVDLDYPHHFCFPAGSDAKPMITAEGFDKLNQYAGIEVFRPRTVPAQDGTDKANPYFERDPKTGAILSVFMRGIGIGYAPTGNLTAVDQTVYINLQTLLVQELQAKIKRYPALGTMGSADQRPQDIVYYGDNGQKGYNRKINEAPTTVKAVGAWHFVALTADLGLWVNISHPEIQNAFESYTQKQRFLERTTFSILKRLILSSHPAIASKTPHVTDLQVGDYKKVISAQAHVIVYGFRADARGADGKRRELEAMAERVAEGERMANMEVIQKDRTNVAEDPEIEDASLVADPNELPPDDIPFPDEEPAAIAPKEKAPEQVVSKPVDAPPPPPKNMRKEFSDLLKTGDQSRMKAAYAAVGAKSWGALRTGPEGDIEKFLQAYQGGAS